MGIKLQFLYSYSSAITFLLTLATSFPYIFSPIKSCWCRYIYINLFNEGCSHKEDFYLHWFYPYYLLWQRNFYFRIIPKPYHFFKCINTGYMSNIKVISIKIGIGEMSFQVLDSSVRFIFALMPLGKSWIHCFSFRLGFLALSGSQSRRRQLWIANNMKLVSFPRSQAIHR